MSAMPATTGQLRTSIHDMEIGDYILCDYYCGGANIGSFLGSLGKESSIAELPLTGGTTERGIFYYVKVAKGYLVADRVIQHSLSWDKINASKFIQGLPYTGSNIIPTMTSNTSPSGVASASSENEEAWNAFSNNNARWRSNTSTGWIAYEFPASKKIMKYSIANIQSNEILLPKDWKFEGSNDGGNTWNLLDHRTGVSFSLGTTKYFEVKKPALYKMYRLLITENNGNTSYVGIDRIEMYDTVGTIRSLTGGVAYADENGNKSTTDQGMGGWPTNNEWDRYIVNFPQELIQPGKTLNDVFHLDPNGQGNCRTWTQDTNSLVRPDTRSTRYKSDGKGFTYDSSNTTNEVVGFRPVFDFRE